MAELFLLLVVSLLGSVEGSERRFVKSGSNLLLEINPADVGKEDFFFWKFNNSVNLVRIFPGLEPIITYRERTDFFKQNFSLLLRNVQHNDTGNYEAQANGDQEKTVKIYTVIVQDPVSAVNLTVTPIDPSCYNFTVTCKTVDSKISGTFQCENKTCHLLDQTHLKDSSLKVYVEESSIICNHSNNLSWEQDVKNVSSLCENPTGSSAVTDVFVKTGDDLILNLTEAEIPPNSRFCVWQFKDDSLVEFVLGSQPNVINDLSGKVEVLEKSYGVKLKDLQKSYSGIYTAKVVTPKNQILTQYNVTVQDPVSPVDLNITYASCSSSSYNLTATCRADDSSISITLRCENQTCNQEGGERRSVTKSGSSLHIYRMGESIVCSHSNQVSRNESIKQIENHCTNNVLSKATKISVGVLVLAVVLIMCSVLIMCKRKRSANTVYEIPQETPQHNPYENPAEITDTPSPTSTYALVQFSNPPVQPSVTSTSTKPQPETIYAQVDRAAKSKPKPAAASR